MAKARRKAKNEDVWTEKYGCDDRPPLTTPVSGIPEAETKARTVAQRNTNHCTICRLHHLGHLNDMLSDSSRAQRDISDVRHKAAERLQDDAAMAGHSCFPSTMNALLGAGKSASGPAEIAQLKIDADKRRADALNAVGASAKFLLLKIVIEDWTLEQAAGIMRVKKNAVLPALRVALDALATHYGMNKTAPSRIRAETIHPFQGAEE